jgi:hypothetical protein
VASDLLSVPPWAARIRRERQAREWSVLRAVDALMAHATADEESSLPSKATLKRRWHEWEAGEHLPGEFYQPIIARMFGTARYALFPKQGRRDGESELLVATGMDTLDILTRVQMSDVDAATLDALRLTVDRLCSEYPYLPSEQLVLEGRQWLRRVADLRSQRLTFAQHREILTLAGWLALLVGCVEYDMGDRLVAEATRKAALGLGQEAGNTEIIGWAHEMHAWFALTTSDYRGVIAASRAGTDAAANHSVAVQLLAQEAKAWARIGDRRQMEVALDRGRTLLDAQPYPDNLDNHFVVDPTKFDFYAMDCYRLLGVDSLAETYADEVIRAGTDVDGTERSPMRIAEARITLGVVAGRQGDVDQAVSYGRQALTGDRKSLPSLLMVSRELGTLVDGRFADDANARDYLDQLSELRNAARVQSADK